MLNVLRLSYWLSRESVIRARGCLGGATQDQVEELLLPPAAIEAVDELVEVSLEVLRADAVEDAPEPGLEVPECAVSRRQDFGCAPPPAPGFE